MSQQSHQNSESSKQSNSAADVQLENDTTSHLIDKRPEAVAQRKLQEMARNSTHVSQLRAFHDIANNTPQSKQTIQQPIQRQENNTGLPDNLKSGMEKLSGHSLDDVRVHRNSDKPAQLQAHAYAQGTNIHLGPGQEKHLPHELGHVVQQKEGRVKPTIQMKGKVNVNDDKGLEKEADIMGAKALQFKAINLSNSSKPKTLNAKFTAIQLTKEANTLETIPEESKHWTNLRSELARIKEGKTTVSKVGATLAKRMGSAYGDDLWDEIQELKKEGGYEEIIKKLELKQKNINKKGDEYSKSIGGPESFMWPEEIEKHLGVFKQGGAHAFITEFHDKGFRGEWGGWGKKNDNNFVAPLPAANALVEKALAGQGIRTIEIALGIPAWDWVDLCPSGIIYRYIVKPENIEKAGLEMAKGLEGGAYARQWISGGETEGGEKEAIIKVFRTKEGEKFDDAISGVVDIVPLDLSEKTPKNPNSKKK